MTAIHTDRLTKRLGRREVAVDALDLTVERGEVFGFLGPNGAGKSTTINMLLDFVRPTSGRATVLGYDAQTEQRALRRRLGILPDGFHLYRRLTGKRHLEFARESKDTDDDIDAILGRIGLREHAERAVRGYSRGMRQRLALGMALVGDPDLVVLDEPSTGLDPYGMRDVRRLIAECRDRGATVFFSSHILSEVESVCDRVAILDRGRLVAVDSIDGLRSRLDAGQQLVLRVDRPDEGTVHALRSLAGVAAVSVDGDSILIEGGPTVDIAPVVAAVERTGRSVLDISTVETPLERLFAEYTAPGSA